jgi:hypothetical protein
VEECPVNISPLSIIIMDMRRYLVMEQSAAPMPLNAMMTNIENNGAPWQYNQEDRMEKRIIVLFVKNLFHIIQE